jgi:hypothetical protein
LIKYIKDAKDKIRGLKKREEKKNKNKEEGGEKTDKKDGGKTKGAVEEDTIKINVYKPNEKDQKREKFNHLKNYFLALLPKQEKEDEKGKNNLDISKDVKAGKLKKIEKKDDDKDFVEQMPGKKKGKKPKEPKDSRKAAKKKLIFH